MQRAVTLEIDGMTLRGMEHVPDTASEEPVPAVILLHGFTGTKLEPHRIFLKISRALEERGIASFRFDFMGSGESDGNFEDMTASLEIRDAKAILEMVRNDSRILPDQVSLLGLSMGGFVAGITAGDLGDAVNKLILLAPAGNLRDIIQAAAAQNGVRSDVPYFDQGGNLVGRCLYDDVLEIDGFERAKPFRGPVLLLHGTADGTVPYQVSEKYRAEVFGERAILRLIDGADHTFNSTPWEREVIREIVTFMTK
ncbi:lysophospholipase [Alicyclobacillus fastidiosus]|uniref:Lysophospholipase n=1 Tax=Alicyclobacillus fastidiosus TaxID=392011 RepID=A0ABY6ZJF7_9BACL|nr:alpha/beta fold hydrolase [Alicyclobacillus fastidiosus]WAH42622.1 lysophospholipase [Alicyclobacillus fastidiosus]GMA64494.1 alpha/beta hydrolase [Alicyclobacillus fastidiosus]